MDRRTFLKTTTAAAAASTATASTAQGLDFSNIPSIASSRQEFTIAVPAAAHHAEIAASLVRDIEIASHGRIILHPTEQALPSATKISAGKYDGALGLFPELCNAPELSLFSGLPGNLSVSPSQLLTWLDAAAGNLFMDEIADEYDLKAFTVSHTGTTTGLWSDQKLTSVQAFKTANSNFTGLGRLIAAADRPLVHQPSDTKQAQLAEYTCDPLVAIGQIPAQNQKIWYRQSVHNQGFTLTLALSQSVWNAISVGDRLIIEHITRAATQRNLAVADNNARFVLPSLLTHRKIEQIPLPGEIAATIEAAAVPITYDAMRQNSIMSRAFDAYSAYNEAVSGIPLAQSAKGSINPMSS